MPKSDFPDIVPQPRPKPMPPVVPVETGSLEDLGISESYALVVGASVYRGAWPTLPGVRRDVEEVTHVLEQHGFNVRVLLDPTRQDLDDAMVRFFYSQIRSEATRLLFYYAGHGFTVEEGDLQYGYIVPVDTPAYQQDLPGPFLSKAVSMSRFQEYSETRARHVMFLFDSCFSGALFEVMRSSGAPGSVRERVNEKSRLFVTAGEKDQEVPDESYFRRVFIDALSGAADRDGDNLVFGRELGEYVRNQVIDRYYGSSNPLTPRWGWSRDHARGDFPLIVPRDSRSR